MEQHLFHLLLFVLEAGQLLNDEAELILGRRLLTDKASLLANWMKYFDGIRLLSSCGVIPKDLLLILGRYETRDVQLLAAMLH